MDFGGFLDGNWEGKWSQNRAKKATKIRWEIVIICNRFVGTFWSQVGRENGPKMHTKRHEKNDRKRTWGWTRPGVGAVYPFLRLGNTRGPL